jgi:heme exporter protein B
MKKSGMLDLLVLVIKRDLVLAMRRRKMAPGVLWVAALLASMLSLGRLFSADYLDGTLEQMMLAPQSLSMLVLGKMTAHWMVSGLPLVLMAPVLGLQFDMTVQALGVLIVGLMLGTPVLSMLGAALTLGLRGGGVLLSLLVLPLCIPVLIFGTGAVEAISSGLSIASHLSLLGALLVMALVFTPWVTAQALRISME